MKKASNKFLNYLSTTDKLSILCSLDDLKAHRLWKSSCKEISKTAYLKTRDIYRSEL
ncbi:hypothetical protein [Aliikangiella sp. IMCC44359]|uniref:hypothetical protein n=1 Tax=Aliikangiella sp. IMCC44359 TaxID=3459125 RepID=UPI00403A9465